MCNAGKKPCLFKRGAVSFTACYPPKKACDSNQMFESDHHSVVATSISKLQKFFTLKYAGLTFIKEATAYMLRMGCLRFRGQASAVDVGKILQERSSKLEWRGQ